MQDGVSLARSLVGRLLVRRFPEGETVCRIVETEAYMGPEDRASHAYGNRRSRRTAVFYGPGGFLYIYLIYGMYHSCNVIANGPGIPQAVLIRALEPLSGVELLRPGSAQGRTRTASASSGRGGGGAAAGSSAVRLQALTSGPGRLCKALEIDLGFYGYDLATGGTLFIAHHGVAPEVAAAPRVNIDYAGQYRNEPWRFYVAGNPFVSRPRPG